MLSARWRTPPRVRARDDTGSISRGSSYGYSAGFGTAKAATRQEASARLDAAGAMHVRRVVESWHVPESGAHHTKKHETNVTPDSGERRPQCPYAQGRASAKQEQAQGVVPGQEKNPAAGGATIVRVDGGDVPTQTRTGAASAYRRNAAALRATAAAAAAKTACKSRPPSTAAAVAEGMADGDQMKATRGCRPPETSGSG